MNCEDPCRAVRNRKAKDVRRVQGVPSSSHFPHTSLPGHLHFPHTSPHSFLSRYIPARICSLVAFIFLSLSSLTTMNFHPISFLGTIAFVPLNSISSTGNLPQSKNDARFTPYSPLVQIPDDLSLHFRGTSNPSGIFITSGPTA